MITAGQTIPVQVKSAWASKINLAQIAAFLSTGAVGLVGILNLDPAITVKVTASVAMIGQALTFVLKTWFTKTVTPQSVN